MKPINYALITILTLCLCSTSLAKTFVPKHNVLEIVIFHTKQNVADKTLLKTAAKVTPLLKTFPGFVSRTFAKGQSAHQWVDIVQWQTLYDAQYAAKHVVDKPSMIAFTKLMTRYKMYHFSIISNQINV